MLTKTHITSSEGRAAGTRKHRIEVVSTSRSRASRSRRLAAAVSVALELADSDVHATDAHDLPQVLCDGRELREYPPQYGRLAERLRGADGVVFAAPIYHYAVAAGTTALLEIVGHELASKPVALITAAGTARAHLGMASVVVPLVFGAKAFVYPTTLQEMGESAIDVERIERFATGFARFVAACATITAGREPADG